MQLFPWASSTGVSFRLAAMAADSTRTVQPERCMRSQSKTLVVNRPSPNPDSTWISTKSWPADVLKTSYLLKMASDSTRLTILCFLSAGERTVGEIVADLGNCTQPAVSHHLTLLKLSGLIRGRRTGNSIRYCLDGFGPTLVRLARHLADEVRGLPVKPSAIAPR